MASSGSYGPVSQNEARAVVQAAIEAGGCLIDTADVYADGDSERLIGSLLSNSEGALVATKVGLVRDPTSPYGVDIVGRPEYLREAVQNAARRLAVPHIDVVFLHRIDHRVPIEESVGCLSDMVAEGHVRGVGISEASVDSILRAHATHPLSAVQSEYSLWSRDVDSSGALNVLQELQVPFIASSPLGKGFLTGALKWPPSEGAKDSRQKLPRFAQESYLANRSMLPTLRGVAERLDASMAQVALAWVAAKQPRTVAIPATRRVERLLENLASEQVQLDAADVSLLDESFATVRVAGERYADMTFVNR
ncbi:aldo/keto reductase [Nocardioides immobilis]|uniref:Aldo/keto reductase n=2 Tax=Nocardioides immobilis TaxID=2049295 RepID=A0A417XYK1_9ACTN|nr:aldo/keto reductase [Nocardioides immobilis]